VIVEGPTRPRVPIERSRPVDRNVSFDAAMPWQFETLTLNDDTVYQGFLISVTHDDAEFAHILRQPGKPMSAIVRTISRGDVKRFDSLPPEHVDILAARFHAFQQRAAIEARNQESITLRPLTGETSSRWVYEGQWFRLESSADDESTRRCVVRIEQMFGGFRQLVPPRVAPRGRLQILLFGAMDEFRAQLRDWNLGIKNPAFYSPGQNMIVAGGDLSRFGDQLEQVRLDHERLVRQFNALDDEFQQQLQSVREEMLAGGFQRDEIRTELALRRTRWNDQQTRFLRDIQEANRRNDRAFGEVTQRMLQRLYHEGFHAYLENFVFPHRDYHVDRWLNEGLAQIFENARFDLGVLRLDAPDPTMLARLQEDLTSAEPLRLVELLAAPETTFLARHADDSSDRRYLYAWGLAYFLAFEQDLLDGDALVRYIAPVVADADHPGAVEMEASADETPPSAANFRPDVDRFESLVGEKIHAFELRWRQFMLDLRPAR